MKKATNNPLIAAIPLGTEARWTKLWIDLIYWSLVVSTVWGMKTSAMFSPSLEKHRNLLEALFLKTEREMVSRNNIL